MNWLTDTVYRRLLGFACWCLGREQDAMDLLHDGLIITARSKAENPLHYCQGVIRKLAAKRLSPRLAYRYQWISLGTIDVVDPYPSPFASILFDERLALVRSRLKRAQPMGQRVISRMLDGQDKKQIMAAEHLTPAQLSMETWRAKAVLKRQVNNRDSKGT